MKTIILTLATALLLVVGQPAIAGKVKTTYPILTETLIPLDCWRNQSFQRRVPFEYTAEVTFPIGSDPITSVSVKVEPAWHTGNTPMEQWGQCRCMRDPYGVGLEECEVKGNMSVQAEAKYTGQTATVSCTFTITEMADEMFEEHEAIVYVAADSAGYSWQFGGFNKDVQANVCPPSEW